MPTSTWATTRSTRKKPNPMTEILEGPEAIVDALARLGLGEVVAFPTETVYGLGADALDEDAVGRVFALKGRPSENPLIVHVSGPEMAHDLVEEWTDEAQALADAFWPGSLTLVLKRSELVPDIVTAGGETVAIRCPAHPIALGLIESLGKPLVGPSANPSGWISPTTSEHVDRGFPGAELLIIEGGPCRAGIESTVLDLSGDVPTILRPGVISHTQMGRVLGVEVGSTGIGSGGTGTDAGSGTPVASPGMLGAHYQPKTPTALVASGALSGAGSGTFVIAWSVDDAGFQGSLRGLRVMPRDPGGYAAALYDAMHQADASGADAIWIETPTDLVDETDSGSGPLWDAILERLHRACR